MSSDHLTLLIPKDRIHEAVTQIAHRINHDYEGKKIILIGILKGSVIFLADLIRQIKVPSVVDFAKLASYGSEKESSGTVKFLKDIDVDVHDQDVIIVEEIIDSGRTLDFFFRRLMASKPKSVKIAALLDKKARRAVTIEADYVGITVEDKFLVGYGLDFNENYRNLPDIYSIES